MVTYPREHPRYGKSAYDPFICQIIPGEDGDFFLYVNPITAGSFEIEGLSEVDGLIDAESSEVQLIEDQSK